jgi:hypothetical protein
MWIMVAGPYRSGASTAAARAPNLAELNQAALALFRAGHVPVIGVNLALPLIEVAGEAADDEAARFRASGRPVFTALEQGPTAR